MSISLLSRAADARADFATWANRSTRVLEPAGYNINNTPTCEVCTFTRGMNLIGNLGIGNGNISLMKPDYLNSTLNAPAPGPAESEKSVPVGSPADNRTMSQEIADQNRTNVSQNNETAAPVPAPLAYDFETDNLYPENVLAGAATVEGRPDSIVIGHPFEHILMEDPVEAAALYGKLMGLPLPDGSVMDVGIKCIGYEY